MEERGRGKDEERNDGIKEGGLGRRNISKNGGKELERERASKGRKGRYEEMNEGGLERKHE